VARHHDPGHRGLVRGLQTAFAEHWLEASGEILPEKEFRALRSARARGHAAGLRARHGDQQHAIGGPLDAGAYPVPGAGGERRANPSRSARRIFFPIEACAPSCCAPVASGVAVTVLMPGKWNNHPIARLASRRRYGALLRGGVRIFEYQAGMIHARC